MKKLVTVLLALSMIVSMGVPASAASVYTLTEPKSHDLNVVAKYDTSGCVSGSEVYSVDIMWDDLTFTYKASGTKTWNPSNHSYTTDADATGSWDKTETGITVTNHSNVGVDVSLAYTPMTPDTGVTGTLDNTEYVLKAGEEGNRRGADTNTSTLTIGGTPNDTVTAKGVKVGTITVIVAKATE